LMLVFHWRLYSIVRKWWRSFHYWLSAGLFGTEGLSRIWQPRLWFSWLSACRHLPSAWCLTSDTCCRSSLTAAWTRLCCSSTLMRQPRFIRVIWLYFVDTDSPTGLRVSQLPFDGHRRQVLGQDLARKSRVDLFCWLWYESCFKDWRALVLTVDDIIGLPLTLFSMLPYYIGCTSLYVIIRARRWTSSTSDWQAYIIILQYRIRIEYRRVWVCIPVGMYSRGEPYCKRARARERNILIDMSLLCAKCKLVILASCVSTTRDIPTTQTIWLPATVSIFQVRARDGTAHIARYRHDRKVLIARSIS